MKTYQVIVSIILIVILAFTLGWYVKPIAPPLPPPGTATVTGEVTDVKTGNPVSDAAVVCNGYGAMTGSDGSYSLSVKIGTCTVIVSKTGYEMEIKSVSVPEEKTYIADISIEPVQVLVPSRLVVGVEWDTATFDPHFASTTPSMYYRDQMFEYLTVERGFDYLPKPELAIDWDLLDRTTYVFHLRKGVKFHDGTPFNATAVKYSIERILNPEVGAPIAGEFVDVIDSVEIIDEFTVKINIKKPLAEFLILMGRAPIVSPTAVEKWGADFASHPVGTGPFKLEEWVPGDHTLFVANKEYWGGQPNIDELMVRVIPEDAVRLVELETGGIDITQTDLFEDAAKLREDPRFGVGCGKYFSPNFIAFNLTHPPLDDVRVRKAIAYALNPQEVVDYIYSGVGYACLGPTAFGKWYNPDLPHYYYNVTKAKELLKEAGYPDGFKFTLLVAEFAKWADVAVVWQAQLQEIGVTMEIDVLEFSAGLERLMDGQFEAYIFSGGDPSSHLRWFYLSTAPYNYNHINNTKLDELILRLQATGEFGERKKIFDEIALEIYNNAYYAYTYAGVVSVNIWSSKVKGYYGDIFYSPPFCSGALGINVRIEQP